MSLWYAQYDGPYGSMSWNSQADGQGTTGNPMSGDTIYPNGHIVDLHACDLSGITVSNSETGTFWSSRWYAMSYGKYLEIYWNSHAMGMGFVNPMDHLPVAPPDMQSSEIDHNGYTIDLADADTHAFPNIAIDGTYFWTSKLYAQADGSWQSCGWNCHVDGLGESFEAPASFSAGTPMACIGTRHVTASAAYASGFAVSVTTGSLTIGDVAAGYTYGDNDASKVPTTCTGAGTLDVAAVQAAAAVVQLATDTAEVEGKKAGILPTTTILGVTGTAEQTGGDGGIYVMASERIKAIRSVTPANDSDVSGVPSTGSLGLMVSVAGDVAFKDMDGASVVLPLAAKVWYPLATRRVLATGTTATGIFVGW